MADIRSVDSTLTDKHLLNTFATFINGKSKKSNIFHWLSLFIQKEDNSGLKLGKFEGEFKTC